MNETLYHYHHPETIPNKSRKETEENEGFYHGFSLALEGYRQYKATGIYPDAEELSKRLKSRFKHDIDLIEELIERTRPKEADKSNREG